MASFIGFSVCHTRAQENIVPTMGHRKLWIQGASQGILLSNFGILYAKGPEFHFNQYRISSVLGICLFYFNTKLLFHTHI